MSIQVTPELLLDPTARIRQLGEYGSAVEVDNNFAAAMYYRSGPQMEKMARTYYAEGQLEEAFILYNKFTTLFVEKIKKHPGYAKVSPADKARVKKLLKSAFDGAMELKDKLKEKYDEEKKEYVKKQQEIEKKAAEKKREQEEKLRREEERRRKEEETKVDQLASFLSETAGAQDRSSASSAVVNPVGTLPSGQTAAPPDATQQELSFQPTHPLPMEGTERDGTGYFKDSHQGGEKDEDEGHPEESFTAMDDMLLLDSGGAYQSDEEESQEVPANPTSLTATNPNLSKVLPDRFTQADNPTVHSPPPYTPPIVATAGSTPTSLHPLPSAPMQSGLMSPPITSPQGSYRPHLPPAPVQQTSHHLPPSYAQVPSWGNPGSTSSHPPPTNPYYRTSSFPSPVVAGYQPPLVPPPTYTGQISAPSSTAMTNREEEEEMETGSPKGRGPPSFDRSLKPSHILSSLGALTNGMRPVIIPSDVSDRFERLASTNTRRDIETCGILAGKLSQNKLIITHIVVPKQKGKSDSCETLNEEELFDVQDRYDLITLGWIHTHPSQTSFLSSVDLHTHCSYQLMLEEAIAIVCAPRYSQVGVYSLTQPHGLKVISNCTARGFHHHPKEPPLFEDSKHVKFDQGIASQIIDLR